MKKAIVTIETKESFYGMDYIRIEKRTIIAEDEYHAMSEIYTMYYRPYNTIKVEFVECNNIYRDMAKDK